MELLSVINNDDTRNEINKFILDNGISEDEVICSIVYEFAKNLPYSIDYKDAAFVPGIFLNVSPVNPKKWIFKDYSSLYNKMINWGDTVKSGILLQICFIFQRMLMGEIPSNYQLSEDDYYNFGIDKMTSDKEYNLYLFEILKSLPEHCLRVNSMKNKCDRRKVLDEVYTVLLQRVGQKVGGLKKTSVNGDVISNQEHKATICWNPDRDLDMLYYFNNIRFGFGVRTLIDEINRRINGELLSCEENYRGRTLSLHD